jgi:hypothetical protein
LPLWKEVLIAKYGNHIAHHEDWSNRSIPASSSSWWKDICSLDNVVATKNWLAESLVRKVGNGASTFFWLSNWINGAPLSIQFPRLFSLSTQKECKVEDFFIRDGEDSRWSFTWRRALFQWEIALLDRLLELLGVVNLTLVDDVWRWTPDPEGIFSVSSAYKYLAKELCTLEELDSEVAWIFEHIWDSPAPSKVIAFSWQLLYDRVPTRCNLDLRRILPPNTPRTCVGCVGNLESSSHLFLHCPNTIWVWYEIFRWLGVVIVIPPNLAVLFEVFRSAAKNKKIRQGFLMIWHATIWSIWKMRNNTIFAEGTYNPKDLVDAIKVLSWKWSLARLKLMPCLFYEWSWDPGDCLMR